MLSDHAPGPMFLAPRYGFPSPAPPLSRSILSEMR